jgi:hypothetical protein
MHSRRPIVLSVLAALSLGGFSLLATAQPSSDPAPATHAPKDPPPPPPPTKIDEPKSDQPPANSPTQPPGERARGPRGGGDSGALPATAKLGMCVMNRSLRTLKRQIGDAAKKDDNLKLIADLERGCLGAKGASPERAIRHIENETERAAAAVTYRKQLITLMGMLLRLETAVIDGKNDEANAILGQINKLRDESHDMLGVKED